LTRVAAVRQALRASHPGERDDSLRLSDHLGTDLLKEGIQLGGAMRTACFGPHQIRIGPTRPASGSRDRDRLWSPDRISLRPDSRRPPQFHSSSSWGESAQCDEALAPIVRLWKCKTSASS